LGESTMTKNPWEQDWIASDTATLDPWETPPIDTTPAPAQPSIWDEAGARIEQRKADMLNAETGLGNLAKQVPVVGPFLEEPASRPERLLRAVGGGAGTGFEPLNMAIGQVLSKGAPAAVGGIKSIIPAPIKGLLKTAAQTAKESVPGKMWAEGASQLADQWKTGAGEIAQAVAPAIETAPEWLKADARAALDATNLVGWGAGSAVVKTPSVKAALTAAKELVGKGFETAPAKAETIGSAGGLTKGLAHFAGVNPETLNQVVKTPGMLDELKAAAGTGDVVAEELNSAMQGKKIQL
jgi:hypothetical protein